jgi:hypothetical protein
MCSILQHSVKNGLFMKMLTTLATGFILLAGCKSQLEIQTMGPGQVTVIPQGDDCQTSQQGNICYEYPAGTEVSLIAMPEEGHSFINYSEPCDTEPHCTLILKEDSQIRGQFIQGSIPPDLVPDPGPDGELTLEGIDSDHDGVRDDVQRHIAIHYAGQPVIQAALSDFVRAKQVFILAYENEEMVVDSNPAVFRGLLCLHNLEPDNHLYNDIKSVLINTKERLMAYIKAQSQLGGHTLDLPETSCSEAVLKAMEAHNENN